MSFVIGVGSCSLFFIWFCFLQHRNQIQWFITPGNCFTTEYSPKKVVLNLRLKTIHLPYFHNSHPPTMAELQPWVVVFLPTELGLSDSVNPLLLVPSFSFPHTLWLNPNLSISSLDQYNFLKKCFPYSSAFPVPIHSATICCTWSAAVLGASHLLAPLTLYQTSQ